MLPWNIADRMFCFFYPAPAFAGWIATTAVQAICGGFRHSSDVPVQDLRANVKDMEKDLGERSERPISAGLVGINGRLTTLNGTISTQAYKITTPAAALFPPVQNILANASETSDLLPNCDHNQDCLSNRTIGTMKAVEKTSVSVRRWPTPFSWPRRRQRSQSNPPARTSALSSTGLPSRSAGSKVPQAPL